MAFVPSLTAPLRATAFSGAAVDTAAPRRVAALRMSDGDNGSSEFGKAGDSMWKENLFTGGFPGGEAFFKSWIEDGGTADVPDMPADMQASAEFTPKSTEKNTFLSKLDKIEFFKGFTSDAQPDAESGEDTADALAPESAPTVPDSDVPDPALYEQYFPAAIRNLAPEINIMYEKNFVKDRVSVAMTEVTASATDLYFPKWKKNKAPIIEFFYDGSSLATAAISLKMDEIEPLPTCPPPAKVGETITSLVPGAGGGLKLEFAVQGTGPVNVYSDPRCVEKYNAMIGK